MNVIVSSEVEMTLLCCLCQSNFSNEHSSRIWRNWEREENEKESTSTKVVRGRDLVSERETGWKREVGRDACRFDIIRVRCNRKRRQRGRISGLVCCAVVTEFEMKQHILRVRGIGSERKSGKKKENQIKRKRNSRDRD